MNKPKTLNGPHTDAYAKTREIVKDLKFCMMTTETPEGRLVSRPMTCSQFDEEGHLWFFAAQDSEQTIGLDFDENVNLAFACTEKSRYLSFVGTAEVVKDRAKIDDLWNPMVHAWFPKGKEDPRLCLIRVQALSAEYWDSPSSKVVKLFEIAKALATHQVPDMSENERVRLN